MVFMGSGLAAARRPGMTPSALRQRRVDPLASVDEAAHGRDRLLEHRLLVGGERDLDYSVAAAGADHDRHADEEPFDAVLAGEMRGAGQDAFLVAKLALGH